MRLVLLRGLARESGHWGDFIDHLSQKINNNIKANGITPLQILTPDCSGCGQFNQHSAFTSISATTDHIRQQIDAVNLNKQSSHTILIGLSMGGMIAMDWARRYPKEISGVVLINSSSGEQPLHWRVRPKALLIGFMSLFTSIAMRESLMLKLVSNNVLQYESNIKKWQMIQQQRPVTRRTIIKQLIAAARFSLKNNTGQDGEAEMSNNPGLILCSKGDRLVAMQCSLDIAKRFDWQISIHPSAGHDLPLDDPDWVVDQLLKWLA